MVRTRWVSFMIDCWNRGCMEMVLKYFQHIMIENLLVLIVLSERWGARFKSIWSNYQNNVPRGYAQNSWQIHQHMS